MVKNEIYTKAFNEILENWENCQKSEQDIIDFLKNLESHVRWPTIEASSAQESLKKVWSVSGRHRLTYK